MRFLKHWRNLAALILLVSLLAFLTRIETLSVPPRSKETNSQYAQKPQEKPKTPDERLADYTWWLTILTGGIVGTGILQCVVLLRTDDSVRRSIGIAERQMLISGAQTDILEKQKEISRQEFLITHRPRIHIRSVGFAVPGGWKPKVKMAISCVNIGNSKTVITQFAYQMVRIQGPVPVREDDRITTADFPDGVSLSAGEPAGLKTIEFDHGGNTDWDFYGLVVHRDEAGVERISGFWARFEEATGTWRRPVDPDFNYEY
jgi:hypothetical protein